MTSKYEKFSCIYFLYPLVSRDTISPTVYLTNGYDDLLYAHSQDDLTYAHSQRVDHMSDQNEANILLLLLTYPNFSEHQILCFVHM